MDDQRAAGRRVTTIVIAALAIGMSLGLAPPAGASGSAKTPGAQASIIGGKPAAPGTFPWMVTLLGPKSLCGGALIAPTVVMTAAHCVTDERTGIIKPGLIDRAVLGRTDRLVPDGEEIPVTSTAVHPGFRLELDRVAEYRIPYFDVALVLLARPALAPTLPIADAALRLREGQQGTVMGWGLTRENDPRSASRTLRSTTVPLWGNHRCSAFFRRFAITQPDPGAMLCAARRTTSADSCDGDSGGPVVVRGPGGGWTAVGVVSYGFGCGNPGVPSVYAWVASPYVRGWVTRRTAGLAAGNGDRAAPRLSGLRAASGTVRYVLSEPAEVVFAVERRRGQRWEPTGAALVHSGTAGQNRFSFPALLRGRPVRAGRYLLRGLVIDAAGNSSTTAVLRLQVG